ncbi:hypothetical protein GCM10017744_049580 [Streptomyces antimycoticus]|uniref:Uncharacterized protein n=1 Tax=Streptomyces antimycoticus TaxID=68175 RepID=A0A4D4K620_9ACTN|nr:hypothetical protein [Streptomyces antimycoticus]GDY44385.1 hypothetical protein SANT12839_052670 [Streptomyces antimycoticus]
MLDSGDIGPGQDRTTTVEKGSFSTARCTCGWYGPARRARGLARDDAAAHVTARHSPSDTSDSSDSSD